MDGWVVHEEVLFAASSKPAAQRLIRSVKVDPGSWWRVESARLDDIEGTRAQDQARTLFYSAAGKVIGSPDLKMGYRGAVLRERRNSKAIEKWLGIAAERGHSKTAIMNMKNSLRYIRNILSHHKLGRRPPPIYSGL
jgi:hypothetical protein